MPPDTVKARKLKGFLTWMLQPEAQRMAAELNYAPLPVTVVELEQKVVAELP
jgi:ABC-type phosphate transport system substrate-binding protein